MATADDLLGAYLSDHLAGSVAALDLIEKLRSSEEGSPLAAFLAELEPEIEADKQVLEQLIECIGEAKNPVKQAGAWVVEKLTRVGLDPKITRSPDLSRLLELEMLAMGIDGKLALWSALRGVTGAHPDVAALDLDDLAARAQSQRLGVENHRVEAAVQAFG